MAEPGQVLDPPRVKAPLPNVTFDPEFTKEKPLPLFKAPAVPSEFSLRIGSRLRQHIFNFSACYIAYTYIRGLRAVVKNDMVMWEKAYRTRVFLMGPLLGFLIAGNGIVPMPFKNQIEAFVGIKAFSNFEYLPEKRQGVRGAAEETKEAIALLKK